MIGMNSAHVYRAKEVIPINSQLQTLYILDQFLPLNTNSNNPILLFI